MDILDSILLDNPTFLTLGLRFLNFKASLEEHPLNPKKIQKNSLYRYVTVTGEFFKKRTSLTL